MTTRQQFLHVIDTSPTIYDISGIKSPKVINGYEQDPIDGNSFAHTFDDHEAANRKPTQFSVTTAAQA